ncbi:MAG: Holliday junction branch migration protein RuvA [Clostridiales bacterium]|nr:Holliday junction branch migration protein RuvA [Clostridiales bacterium]
MIGYIKGKVLDFDNGMVLLENNGIGYEITCSASVYAKLVNQKEGEVYTYLSVSDQGVSLYGFISREEKAMFLKLISVSGVGPKGGIGILSNINLEGLALAIATSDIKTLSGIKGCGKKTAERIIVELREKMGEINLTTTDKKQTITTVEANPDAVMALLTLGFSKQESTNAVKLAEENGAKGLQEIIAFALKNMR